MEKKAQRKSYRNPALNKIIQEKAAWNKQVSALINDLIHFKKSMNGWPSKYHKERTRIMAPMAVDLPGILNQLSSEFQEIASSGNSILQEQAALSKSHLKKKTDDTLNRLEQAHGPVDQKPSAPPTPDLAQQLGKGASSQQTLIKLAFDFENKYFLESQASNPFSRFITRLFNPKFGFGEAARIRRLRMTMLDNCVKAFKTLKVLQAEVVKSSKQSIVNSHKMMTLVWNYWNIVNRLLGAYRSIRPGEVKETGGKIEDPLLKREKETEEGRDPDATSEDSSSLPSSETLDIAQDYATKIADYQRYAPSIKSNSPSFLQMNSIVEKFVTTPKNKKIDFLLYSKVTPGATYSNAIREVNAELGTSGSTFEQIAQQLQGKRTKEAQEFRGFLGKTRHQLLPGATSGSRLEVYNLIVQIKDDLDHVMNLLESGFDQKKLAESVAKVNREMSALRTIMRSLYYSEKPEEAPPAFF